MKILVLAPMDIEASNFRKALNSIKSSKHTYKIISCGVGKVNAASTVASELSVDYDLVTCIGYAAASKNFNKGEIVFPKSTVQYDVHLPSNIEIPELTKTYELEGCEDILCLTGDSFVDKSLSEQLTNQYGNNVIFDMECGAIAQVCEEYGAPLLLMKIISDIPELDSSETFIEFINTVTDFTSFVNFLENI